jgi:hypothetical protein
VRALRRRVVDKAVETEAPRERKRRYGATIKDALTALWEASDRVCGKRLVAMIPTLVPALAQHGRLQPSFCAGVSVACSTRSARSPADKLLLVRYQPEGPTRAAAPICKASCGSDNSVPRESYSGRRAVAASTAVILDDTAQNVRGRLDLPRRNSHPCRPRLRRDRGRPACR